MQHILRMTAGCGVLLVAVGIDCSLSASDGAYDRPTGFHHTVRWESPVSSAKGFMFFRSSAQGAIKRMLIESPKGRHLVLTNALLVRHGIDREELRDEETGWYAELVKRIDFRPTSFSEYLAGVEDWYVPGEGKQAEMTLRTSTGVLFSAEVPLQSQPYQEHASFAALLKRELGGESVLEVPAGIKESLAFLDAAYERSGSDSRGIIEILSGALGISSEAGGSEWRQVDGDHLRAPELVDSADIAFASHFGSLDPISPLPVEALDVLARELERKVPGRPEASSQSPTKPP